MLSAPAAIPATRHGTFRCALTPHSPPGRTCSATRSPARRAPPGPSPDQAGVRHEIRVVERCVRLRQAMQQSHLQGVLSNRELEASDTPIVPVQRAPFTLTRPKTPLLDRWIEAKGRDRTSAAAATEWRRPLRSARDPLDGPLTATAATRPISRPACWEHLPDEEGMGDEAAVREARGAARRDSREPRGRQRADRTFPRLFHLAEAGSAPAISEHGLLPARRLCRS